MDTKELAVMLHDKHFFDLKKMQYKYTPNRVSEMLEALQVMSWQELPLRDFAGNPCVYLPAQCSISTSVVKKLLTANPSKDLYGRKAMEEEINSTLQIENIHSNRESVRRVMQGYAPINEEEQRIYGMKKAIEFISNPENKITEENLHRLYMLSVGDYLEPEDRLPEGCFYRNDAVYVVGDRPYHQGLPAKLLPEYMEQLIRFANQKDEIPELAKAGMLHFYMAYLHPYFDGNGRTARYFHIWYLMQQGFSSTLFYAFSKYINASKSRYYDSILMIEENQKISGRIDLTPFIRYFKEDVYDQIETVQDENAVLPLYAQAMEEGKITEKERDLWSFVLLVYGTEAFSTKQLEKEFGNAAYATIRSFVLKFEKLGLLQSQRYGNRVKYQIKS